MLFAQTHRGATLCRVGDPAVPSVGVEQTALWGRDDVVSPTSAFSIWPITCVLQRTVRKLSHPGVRGGMGFLLVFVLKQTRTILPGANRYSGRSCLWGISISLFSDVCCVICFIVFWGLQRNISQNPHGFKMLGTTMSWFRENEFRVFLKSLGRS